MKNLQKIILASLVFFLPLIVSGQLRTFVSEQVGTSPSNGKVLQTDGSNSSWVATSSLGITSGVSSVSNSNGTLTISPTTGAVVASLNLSNTNTWTGTQQFNQINYANGQAFTDINSYVYYPNGQYWYGPSGNLHYPNGAVLADTSAILYYNDGMPFADSAFGIKYPTFAGNGVFVDNLGNGYYPSGSALWDSSGNLYGNGSNITGIDHGGLSGLNDDDHVQYVAGAGRASGQIVIGGTGSGDNLNLKSTSHATKGKVTFGNSATTVYDEVNERVGVASSTPFARLSVKGVGTGTAFNFQTTNSSNLPLISGLDNGHVGIGYTTPGVTSPSGFTLNSTSRVLEIRGSDTAGYPGLFLRRSDGATGFDLFNDRGTGINYLDALWSGSGALFTFRGNTAGSANTLMNILGSGRVAIGGTTAPNARLHIDGSTGVVEAGNLFQITNSAGNTAFTLDNGTLKARFYSQGGASHAAVGYRGAVGMGITADSDTGSLTLIVNNDAKTYLTSNGFFGIGTSSPYARLSVHQPNGATNNTIFAIASSTASATTTLFTVKNTGDVGINIAPYAGVPFSVALPSGSNGTILRFARSAGAYYYDIGVDSSSNFFFNDAASNTVFGNTTSGNLFTGANLLVNTESFIGTNPVTTLMLYAPLATTTLTDLTQNYTNGGVLEYFEMVSGGEVYSPGIFGNSRNNNSTKPKYGIWGRHNNVTGDNSAIMFGTSDSWATGITNYVVFDKEGWVGIGTTTPTSVLSVFGNSANPTTPLLTVASSTKTAVFEVDSKGHVLTGGTSPSVSSCGTSPSLIKGNDNAGRIQVGSVVATSCQLDFATTWDNPPICDGNVEGGITTGIAASSTVSSVVFTGASALTGNIITYQCFGIK